MRDVEAPVRFDCVLIELAIADATAQLVDHYIYVSYLFMALSIFFQYPCRSR